MNVGVLALQGSVAEHMKMITSVNKKIDVTPVRTIDELSTVDGLIIPGDEFDLYTPVKARIEAGMPVWGTCAGLILLADSVENEKPYFGLLDVSVKRNAYGRQIDSFVAEGDFAGMYIGMVFIRAPKITRVGGDVEVLAEHDGTPVAVRQKNILATSFHPEMMPRDNRVHKYFINMIDSKV